MIYIYTYTYSMYIGIETYQHPLVKNMYTYIINIYI